MTRDLMDTQLKDYKRYLEDEEKSPMTVVKYLRDLWTFFDFLGENALEKAQICAYKYRLKQAGYAAASINAMLASVNHFVTWIGMEVCRVKTLRVQRMTYRDASKELTQAEYERLLNAAKDQPQLLMILETLAGTGIRISELRFFTVEDVRKGKIEVQCKRKIRTILIPGKLRKKLLNYAKKQGITSGEIFITRNGKSVDRSNVWKQMKALGQKAGVEASKVFPHNFRKLFARIFYRASKDIAKLADILGHSSVETTRIYIMGTGEEHRRQMESLGLVR